MIKKQIASKAGLAIVLTMAFFIAYYLLLRDNSLHASIGSIIHACQHQAFERHLIILGLLPVYIAIIIFGTASLGIYTSRAIHGYYLRFTKKALSNRKQD